MTDERDALEVGAGPTGFFDCRGNWHSLDEEPTTLDSSPDSR